MQHQAVLSEKSHADLDTAYFDVSVDDTGETLRLRELKSADGWTAIGTRYDFPDNEGRLWRTECVLSRSAAEGQQDLLRLRAQCLARTSGANLETPKKPYLLKTLLKNGWGGTDQSLHVSDQPIWLEANEADQALACSATLGNASKWLPCVYVSSTGLKSWALSSTLIDKLAYDLGGLAHVLVEPDREFSFDLRDATDARNVYGGTIGLALPGEGLVRSYFLGWRLSDERALASAVKTAVANLRSRMPANGWDWTDLQEQALRTHRQREKNLLSPEESEKLYLEEIEGLSDRVQELEARLKSQSSLEQVAEDSYMDGGALIQLLGPEVYPGELMDRLRLAAFLALKHEDLDKRSKAILERLTAKVSVSPGLRELEEDLKRATKDPKRVASDMTRLLCRHGYAVTAQNNHVRLHPSEDYEGLEPVTLPKTPSEARGLQNLRKQVRGHLGISRVPK